MLLNYFYKTITINLIMKHILYIFILVLFANCQRPTTKKQIMDKNTPEYKAFMAQENRFELNGCELKYNDKPFKLGMTIKEMENVFGKKYKKKNGVVEFKNLDFIAWYENETINGIKIFLSEKSPQIYLIGKTFLIGKDKMQRFLIKSDGYRLSNKKCNYQYDFESPVAYHRIGGGHLYTQGDWKLDETNPITAISIYKISKKLCQDQ